MFSALADMLVFLTLFGSIYFVFPLMAVRAAKEGCDYRADAVPEFVRATFFLQLAGILLGNWRLCGAGTLLGLYAIYLCALGWQSAPDHWTWPGLLWRKRLLYMFRWAEWLDGTGKRRAVSRRFVWTPPIAVGAALGVGLLVVHFLYPLNNQRFLSAENYARAVSIEALTRGDIWSVDGSVAFLAPLASWSGLGGAAVIRWCSAIVPVLLAAGAAWTAWRWTRLPLAGLAAAALQLLLSERLGWTFEVEAAGGEWAALFVVLSAGLLRDRPQTAALGAITAFLAASSPGPRMDFIVAAPVLSAALASGIALACVYILNRAFPILRTGLAVLVALPLSIFILTSHIQPARTEPLQYEAAAQAASRIARELPRNQWMVISSPEEAAFTYGRGWRLDLAEFVQQYTPQQVKDPSFRFPFQVPEVFVFVELQALPRAAAGAASASDLPSYFYNTSAGRASLAYRAARMITAYASSHEGVSVYYEDERLRVFRLAMK